MDIVYLIILWFVVTVINGLLLRSVFVWVGFEGEHEISLFVLLVLSCVITNVSVYFRLGSWIHADLLQENTRDAPVEPI